jgi:aryl-alcohol dehydrogenase-like predicted oxidoreductase
MKYAPLGRTGLNVSRIGLGCSGFWGDKLFEEKSAHRVVHKAFDEGVTLFDTGSNYSNFNAEPRLGRAIQPIIAAGKRDRLILSTKAGSTFGYAPHVADNDMSHTDFSSSAIEQSCLKSIQNLGCDYIDIFQLHGLSPEAFGDELFDTLLSLKQRGLIRHIGINTHFVAELEKVIERADIFDMVLIDCNLLQLDRYEIVSRLHAAGIGVVVGTVLAQGHLVSRKIGSLRNGSFFWYLARTLLKPTTRDFNRHAGHMRRALAQIPEMAPAQAAFAYLLRNQNITACLFGTTNEDNVSEVVESTDIELTDKSAALIEEAAAAIPSLSR